MAAPMSPSCRLCWPDKGANPPYLALSFRGFRFTVSMFESFRRCKFKSFEVEEFGSFAVGFSLGLRLALGPRGRKALSELEVRV